MLIITSCDLHVNMHKISESAMLLNCLLVQKSKFFITFAFVVALVDAFSSSCVLFLQAQLSFQESM